MLTAAAPADWPLPLHCAILPGSRSNLNLWVQAPLIMWRADRFVGESVFTRQEDGPVLTPPFSAR